VKKTAITLLKIGLSVGILAFLFWRAQDDPAFDKLRDDPKNWSLLAAAWAVCGLAVTVTLVRWWLLVRALELPLPLSGALRIGFLGYLFNLAPMGLVGGDLLKAVMLARENRTQRTRAVASVAVDRTVGLLMLFIVATTAIFACGYFNHPHADIRWVCRVIVGATILACFGVLLLISPGITLGRGTAALERIPHIGPILNSLIESVRMYRRQPLVILVAIVMSAAVHVLFATGIYLIARGLPGVTPPYLEHLVIAPVSSLASIIPLPAGPQEGAIQYMYGQLASAAAKGLVIGLTYRIITILIAMVGVGYYLAARREVTEVIHDVEEEQEHEGRVLATAEARPSAER